MSKALSAAAILAMQSNAREFALRHEVIHLAREGLTIPDISVALGLHPSQVNAWLGFDRGGPA